MDAVRSPRAKVIYIEELDAFVQEDLILDVMASLCSSKECEPPFGGKEDCEFYKGGICTAASIDDKR